MTFEAGKSGNPLGRPVGVGRVAELKRLLFSRSEELIATLIDKALEGDSTAMKMAIDRLLLPLKAVDMPVSIPHADSGSPVDQSSIVIGHLLSGAIPPDQAARIMQTLQAHFQMSVIADLERRIAALESANDAENPN